MLSVGGSTRVFLCTGVTDMRLGFNGLYAIIESRFGRPSLSGDYYVFANRSRKTAKIFFYDSGGRCIFSKRLEKFTFKWPKPGEELVTITHAELQLLLSGIDLTQTRQRQWWQVPPPAAASSSAAKVQPPLPPGGPAGAR